MFICFQDDTNKLEIIEVEEDEYNRKRREEFIRYEHLIKDSYVKIDYFDCDLFLYYQKMELDDIKNKNLKVRQRTKAGLVAKLKLAEKRLKDFMDLKEMRRKHQERLVENSRAPTLLQISNMLANKKAWPSYLKEKRDRENKKNEEKEKEVADPSSKIQIIDLLSDKNLIELKRKHKKIKQDASRIIKSTLNINEKTAHDKTDTIVESSEEMNCPPILLVDTDGEKYQETNADIYSKKVAENVLDEFLNDITESVGRKTSSTEINTVNDKGEPISSQITSGVNINDELTQSVMADDEKMDIDIEGVKQIDERDTGKSSSGAEYSEIQLTDVAEDIIPEVKQLSYTIESVTESVGENPQVIEIVIDKNQVPISDKTKDLGYKTPTKVQLSRPSSIVSYDSYLKSLGELEEQMGFCEDHMPLGTCDDCMVDQIVNEEGLSQVRIISVINIVCLLSVVLLLTIEIFN